MTVQGVTQVVYRIQAEVKLESGISKAVMSDAVRNRISSFIEEQNHLGAVVPLSGIYAAIHGQTGVLQVVLNSPAADVTASLSEAPFCEAIELEFV